MLRYLVIASFLGLAQGSTQLPPGIKMCAKTNNLHLYNQCARDVIEKLKPHLARGIPNIQLSAMEPTLFPMIKAQRNLGIVQADSVFKNFKIRGFTNFQINDLQVDPHKLSFIMKAYVPQITIESQYELGGSILFVPLGGSGSVTGIMRSLNITLIGQGKEVVDRNGVRRIKVDTFRMLYDIDGGFVKLTTSYNRFLTQAMENIFNSNSKLVLRAVKPLIDDISSALMKKHFVDDAVFSFTKEELLPTI